MIRNIIFDFGSVLVDWNPEYLYRPYFNNDERLEHFLSEVCPYSWNTTVDAGRSTADATAERIALYPEWEKEIRMYYGQWIKMMNGEIPGMRAIVEDLRQHGYGLYGLTNWSAETFCLIRNEYPIFRLLDGIVVSGEEKINKPDPRIYRILLGRYGLNPEECLFIDDNPVNISAGEALGIRGIVFKSPEDLKKQLVTVLGR